MATYSTTGFIIRRADYGEGDRILTLFTQYKGKITAVAKGVRKSTSRKGGNVELFNLTRFQLATGKNMDLIVEAEVQESYKKLRDDLFLISLVYQLVELVDQFVQEGQSNSLGYQLFKTILEQLNSQPTQLEARKLLVIFQVKFLTTVGFKPELNQCVKCGHRLSEEGNYFSPSLGGVVDSNCRQLLVDSVEVSNSAIKALRFFGSVETKRAVKLSLEQKTLVEVESLLQLYLEHVLEKSLKAVNFTQKTQGL